MMCFSTNVHLKSYIKKDGRYFGHVALLLLLFHYEKRENIVANKMWKHIKHLEILNGKDLNVNGQLWFRKCVVLFQIIFRNN